MLVEERFYLPEDVRAALRSRPIRWGFGAFSEAVYYRTYSRRKEDGGQETWADTVIRVVEGVMSIRKDHYKKHGIRWDKQYWDAIAARMALFMFDMKFLPPGRGLWAMGTDYVFERGSHALNNCGFIEVEDDLGQAAYWLMDSLMLGVGVGFSTNNARLRKALKPGPNRTVFSIPDSREGWVQSVQMLIDSYFTNDDAAIVEFDYSQIRPAGSPIRGFGGVASGPEPLRQLHERIRRFLDDYADEKISSTRLIVDVMNAIGACVVAGNVRRSAELATGSIYDKEFLNLKNYELYPERAEIGWMSNNSVVLRESDDFLLLPTIADRIRDNGEPGVINLMNVQKYGRFKEKWPDRATGFNPCAEIPLESYELCNLAEVFPTRCRNEREIYEAMELATIYASTVALLPSHSWETNKVVERNRRIGVSISGIADWVDATNIAHLTRVLRNGYERVVFPTNRRLADEAQVAPSIRITTVKPSGTISQLAGVSPGMHWPVHRYYIRRMRVSEGSPVAERLIAAGIPYEPDLYSDNTLVFEFPQAAGKGKTRSVSDVSIWEQAAMVAFLQREWADNAVSNTLTFSKSEAKDIEKVLSMFAPQIKSMSMLPDDDNVYEQMPYERITKQEYEERMAKIQEVDWSTFSGDGQDSRFCDGDVCEVKL